MKKQLLVLILCFLSFGLIAQVANQPSDFIMCDDGFNDGSAEFDLSQKDAEILQSQDPLNYTVSYYESEANALAGTGEITVPFTNYTNPQTIFATVTENSTGDFDITNFDLIVNPGPEINQQLELIACSFDGSGFGEFDLTQATQIIIGTQTEISVTYYETEDDVESAINPITNLNSYYNTTPNYQLLYVRAESNVTGCFTIGYLNLIVSGVAPLAEISDYVICDDVQDGVAEFDLYTKDSEALVGQNDFELFVSYYLTEADAVNQTNALPYVYTNVFNPQTIYVAVSDYFGCNVEIQEFDLIADQCDDTGLISMNAFIDTNTNDDFDIGEPNFTYGSFTYEKNDDGVINVVNSSNGSFTIFSTEPNDTYDITFSVNPEFMDCYSQNVTVFNDISVALGDIEQFYFPVEDNLTCEDLGVYLLNPSASPRPGFEHTNLLIIENLSGTEIASGSVEFTLDDDLQINSIIASDTNMNITTTATGFTVDFTNLGAGESETVTVTLLCPATVSLGEIVTNSVIYTTSSNDSFVENNSSQLSETVIGAYDPNDKMEAHGPQIIYDDFVTSDEYLFYTIRFQNVGTAEAINVRIEDVLDSQLDESTFQMLRSSHDYVVTRTANSLEWNFENINLPAEQDDAEGSNGYVYFKIKPNAGYAVGDIIENSAAIYFDFNDPIITNTFQTEFVETLSVGDFENSSFRLFPNPAQDKVTIQLANSNSGTTKVDIYNIQGKLVLKDMKLETNTSTIDISNLESGLYFVQLTFYNSSTVQKLMVD
ncbi:DUF7619 domain-containing protein [Winogradskyella forsetii]|uniref:DUF7619 domain-containing protein n=1 Tax=Winogradskyella forsetii TaxID=2686077 RepID=UPI0015BE61BA|nr:T9SS type A sorting domain-containing protein [Winogradskyella forsetii]